jgi:Putative beta-barrel porin 2
MVGSSLVLCAAARAVYAPIPEQEQGKDFTATLETGITYNTNIFGAPTDPIASTIFEVSPKLTFNASVTDSTFFSADFQPTLDYFENRPGKKTVYSQEVDARLSHSFAPTSVLFAADTFSYNQNPEALLNGVAVNSDQTLESNEFDSHYSFAPTEQLGLVAKARSLYYDYTNPSLGGELNRFENLYGLEADYTLFPNLKGAGEYRHLDVDYSNDPSDNNKHSDFLMAGLDYNPDPKTTLSFRLGGERRIREGLSTETSPYAEATARYNYAPGSFVSLGYTYSTQETSDPITYSDERTNRMFINVQHSVTALIVASASLDYEPSHLIGRPGHANISEDMTAAGLALTYIPERNWTVSATYDYDFVDSAVAARGFNRSRYGVTAKVVF